MNDFAEEAWPRIRSLSRRLSKGQFTFDGAIGVLSPKIDSKGKKTGKFRPIVLAPVDSRIVQRALLDTLVDIEDLRTYFDTPFSFGGIRKLDGSSHGSLSGVPAAVSSVLEAIRGGAKYFVCADIQSFFTRIPRESVLHKIGELVRDNDFIEFLREAVSTELSNLAELKEHSDIFPIQEIGVAQGNSLSPLFGNIALAKFDLIMNSEGHRCIRYVDDFIILEKTASAAHAQLRKAQRILSELKMDLSPEKTSKGAQAVTSGIEFLGVHVIPGLIRPAQKTQTRLLSAVSDEIDQCIRAMTKYERGSPLQHQNSVLATLRRIDGMIEAWGKSYRFCNDESLFSSLDKKVSLKLHRLFGSHRSIRDRLPDNRKNGLLGITSLKAQTRNPLIYPKNKGDDAKLLNHNC